MIEVVWLTWFFLIASALVGAGAFFYLKRQERSAGEGAAGSPARRPSRGKSLRDFWEVKDVRGGVIELYPGGRYRLVCRVAAQDFYLLSEAEQNAAEDALASALLGLSFPVQTVCTAETLDTRGAVAALRESARFLPEKVQRHALARADYLEAVRENRAVAARNAYIVIPFDTAKGFDHAAGELYARAASLQDALSGAKVRLEPLDTAGVCDLLAHVLNRGRAWRPSDAGEMGVMAEFHVAEKEAVFHEA
ncbi:MAG: hypothetical protein ACUVSK_07300 [Desulfotomaculales bacterium]